MLYCFLSWSCQKWRNVRQTYADLSIKRADCNSRTATSRKWTGEKQFVATQIEWRGKKTGNEALKYEAHWLCPSTPPWKCIGSEGRRLHAFLAMDLATQNDEFDAENYRLHSKFLLFGSGWSAGLESALTIDFCLEGDEQLRRIISADRPHIVS
jgi:hypothetical protein